MEGESTADAGTNPSSCPADVMSPGNILLSFQLSVVVAAEASVGRVGNVSIATS